MLVYAHITWLQIHEYKYVETVKANIGAVRETRCFAQAKLMPMRSLRIGVSNLLCNFLGIQAPLASWFPGVWT